MKKRMLNIGNRKAKKQGYIYSLIVDKLVNYMSNWQYKTKSIDVVQGIDKILTSELNNEGKDRWELCGIREIVDVKGKRSITCIFKQEILPKAEKK